MFWIVSMIFAVLVCGGVRFLGGVVREAGKADNDSSTQASGAALRIGAIALFVVWVGLHTLLTAIHIVPAGHVGVIYTFGGITGQTGDGLVVTAPWQSVKKATVQVQTLCFMDDEKRCPSGATHVGEGLDSFSQETQNVFIDAVLRIKVSPSDVQGLYRNVGESYVNKLIPGQVAQVFKDETVNYPAVDIAPNREVIRANVEIALEKELSRFSIDVDALLIENMVFEKDFEDAILQKQKATQEALKQQELIKAREAEAEQKIAEARGNSEKLRIEAEGQAKANALISGSLTPMLIQFQALQRLADNVQIMLLPSGEGIIIDPSTILKSTEQAK